MRVWNFGAVVLTAFTIACATQVPTEASNRTGSERPRFDGGVMYGSGNRADSTSTNQNAAPGMEAAATESGVMYGSGN
ncbi:MAG TPA: hypothetical protein VFJ16_24510 [Longimicrobium sp.]|nr:hypothetical protein [Longimicrobium sp.]